MPCNPNKVYYIYLYGENELINFLTPISDFSEIINIYSLFQRNFKNVSYRFLTSLKQFIHVAIHVFRENGTE